MRTPTAIKLSVLCLLALAAAPAFAADADLASPKTWLRRAIVDCQTSALSDEQAEALSLAAAGQVKAGDWDGLRLTLITLRRRAEAERAPAARALAFSAVADLCRQLGEAKACAAALDSAKAAARDVDEESARGPVDLRIACLSYATGDAPGADDFVRAVKEPTRKSALYCALALEASSGRDRPACAKFLQYAAAAAADQDDATTARILCQVAQAYARAGDFDSARLTVEAMPEGSRAEQTEAYAALARHQSKAGDARGSRDSLAHAKTLIAPLPPAQRFRAYLRLCYEQNDLADRDGARQTLTAAAACAPSPVPAWIDGQAAREGLGQLFDLAEANARLGDVAGCRAALEKAEAAWAALRARASARATRAAAATPT